MAHIDKYYRTLKSFGAPVDIINESKDLSQYPVVIAPAYQMADKTLADRWNEYVRNGGNLVLTCRTAQKDRYMAFTGSSFRLAYLRPDGK